MLSACAEYLMARLSAENVLDTEMFADSLGCTMLVTSCQKFIKKFFVQVVGSEDFLHLCLDKLSGLVSEDELDVTSEEVVFNAVLTWVKHDPEMRAEALPKLLSCVRQDTTLYFWTYTLFRTHNLTVSERTSRFCEL